MTAHHGATAIDRSSGLDLLRVLACALVVVFHIRKVLLVDFGPLNSFVDGGDTGVFIFFALSGYLLYRPFLRDDVDLGSYAIKRSARILPGYFVALACLALITRSPLAPGHVLPYVSMTSAYNVELRGFLGNAWTLSAEIVFYILLPAIANLVRVAPIPRLSVLALVSVVANVLYGAVDRPGIEWLVGAFPFVFYAFVPGMLVAVIEARDPRLFQRLRRPGVGMAGLAAIVAGLEFHGFPIAIGAGTGTAFLIAWLSELRLPFGRTLAFAGGASYAMYLWHKDLLMAFGGLGVLIAVAGAAASWALVERPVLRLARVVAAGRRTPIEPAIAVVAATP